MTQEIKPDLMNLEDRKTGERIGTVDDLLWYIENSRLFMYTMMGSIKQVLEDVSVKALQDKGITVLLTIPGGHHEEGWSNFKTEAGAKDFANYLESEVVDKYGLDGIDIDDEYSEPDKRIHTSLVTVTSLMQQIMPGKIISKALFDDLKYFGPIYEGKTLAQIIFLFVMAFRRQPGIFSRRTLVPYHILGGMFLFQAEIICANIYVAVNAFSSI